MTLAHRTTTEIEATGVQLLLDHYATSIDVERKQVSVRTPASEMYHFSYDQLILGTGATLVRCCSGYRSQLRGEIRGWVRA